MKTRTLALAAVAVVGVTAGGASLIVNRLPTPAVAAEPVAATTAFAPPADSAIPAGKFGDVVRFGEQIFREPGTYAPQFVGNQLRCSNCHLQAGRLAGASPMWAAYTAYPAYRSKNGHVNTFAERLAECFRFSMNGKEPPPGDKVLVALESYSYFLAKGLPTGENAPGRGFPALPQPPQPADYARGAKVYAENCAACHGADGLGQSADGKVAFPPLWGPHSFNWGAGMGSIKNAAEFIRANMPLGQGGSLSVQQAWDVAAYMDSQMRPQDPRFTGDVEQTRKTYHDTPFSMYGRVVNGVMLGDPASTPPAGAVPVAAVAAPAK
jgi:thiosulfate dehydrogenase